MLWYGYELVERAKNFFIDYKAFERQALENVLFYMNLYDMKNCMVSDLDEMKEQTNEQTLESVFSTVFQFITNSFDEFTCFNMEPFYTSVYESCLFTSLCMFLNKTRRIKGKSLNQFVLENSLYPYNDKNSEYYSPNVYSSDILMAEGTALRKARHRKLSERPVYDIRPPWAAMPMDSEYEWALHCIFGNRENNLQHEWTLQHNLSWKEFRTAKDTLKRIGNLYNEIKETLKTEKDAEYIDRIKKIYAAFKSKLNKIDYTDYLTLQKMLLSYIDENDKYYGINIYRLEKELKPYIITNEVNHLLKCENSMEENDFLSKSVIMSDICFPKLYNAFGSHPASYTSYYTKIFFIFQDYIVKSCLLIIDELIETGYLGKNWEDTICKTINKITESVFYVPKEIEYTTTSKSQEKFAQILSAPVEALLYQATGTNFFKE